MKKMTKLVAFLLALCMVISLTACGKEPTAFFDGTKNATKNPEGTNLFENQTVTTDENGNTFIQLGDGADQEKPEPLPLSKNEDKNEVEPSFDFAPKGEYNEGVVLVKFEKKFSAAALGELDYTSA